MEKNSIIISSLALNNQKLDELIQTDYAKGATDPRSLRDAGETAPKLTGLNVPFISINGYSITNFLTKFSMDLNGFIPIVRFSFIAVQSTFISVNYPKDGDIVSIYMRSPGDVYKPIRMDFNITNVYSEPSSAYAPGGSDPEAAGKNLRFTILGECRIPGLYSQRIKSFRNVSSHDALLEASQDLNLGFASNDRTLNDKMNWICPNYSYYDFIQDVSLHAYKDDEQSFFDCWIDPYYNLNFVNLGSQFSFNSDPGWKAMVIPGYSSAGLKVDSAIPGSPETSPIELPLVITNHTGFGVIPYYINGYTLTSRAGNNTNEMGYITDLGFYDESLDKTDPSEKYIKYSIESQTIDNITSGVMVQKGRARDNSYKEETRREWMGVLNSKTQDGNIDGVHSNYYHAKYQNLINIKDATKLTLEVELVDFFPGIYRGQVLPVNIYVFSPGLRQQNAGNKSNNDANTILEPTMDLFLSGNYVVMGMDIYWSYGSPGMRQRLILAKRTWKANTAGAIPKAFPISPSKNIF